MGMDSNSEVMNINGHFKKNKKPGKETSSTSRAEFNTTRILEFDSSEPPQGEKSWLYKLNPFRQGSVPPVPKEKLVTKEYNAGFISRLYFHWMTPLMAATSDSFMRMISGVLTPDGRQELSHQSFRLILRNKLLAEAKILLYLRFMRHLRGNSGLVASASSLPV